jgi:GAF domain-containing protein
VATDRTHDQEDVTTEVAGDLVRGVLHDLVLETVDVREFLDRLVRLAAQTLDGRVSAGVTLAREGRDRTVASSDSIASRFDELQYGLGDGPCLTAIRTGEEVLVADLEADERFADYREHAAPLGLRSCLAFPLSGSDGTVGALNMYSDTTAAFDAATRAVARQFAGEAERALRLAVRLAQQAELTEQLRTALTSRAVIDQAMGVIMGQSRCSAEAAFEMLRKASQHRNVKLRVLAAEIVESASGAGRADEGTSTRPEVAGARSAPRT